MDTVCGEIVTPDDFKIFDATWNHPDSDDKTSRRMLSESRSVVVHWGTPCRGLWVDGDLITVNVTSFSKRPRKNAWGRYLNFYLAYTRPLDRYKGYATHLAQTIEKMAVGQGYSRLKSLAGSYAGVRLHMAMGHHFWGIGKGGALIVDTPISDEKFPEGVPIEARNATAKAIAAGWAPIGQLSSDPMTFTPTEPKRMDVEDIRLALLRPPFGAAIPDFVLNCYSQKVRP